MRDEVISGSQAARQHKALKGLFAYGIPLKFRVLLFVVAETPRSS
jgi:hypothetical protein